MGMNCSVGMSTYFSAQCLEGSHSPCFGLQLALALPKVCKLLNCDAPVYHACRCNAMEQGTVAGIDGLICLIDPRMEFRVQISNGCGAIKLVNLYLELTTYSRRALGSRTERKDHCKQSVTTYRSDFMRTSGEKSDLGTKQRHENLE
jgi:hypothetical protein